MRVRKSPIYRVPGYCHCGAPCETKLRCPKCRARFRWYRRKAWRSNPAHRAVSETTSHRSSEI